MTPQEFLLAAADLVEAAPKLAKGVFSAQASQLDDSGCSPLFIGDGTEDSDLCYCLDGALRAVANSEGWDGLHSARAVLVKFLNISFMAELFQWNDAPERTKDEVVQALRGAAAIELVTL